MDGAFKEKKIKRERDASSSWLNEFPEGAQSFWTRVNWRMTGLHDVGAEDG